MNKIKNSVWLSILFAIAVAVVVFLAANLTGRYLKPLIQPFIGDSFYSFNIIFKIILFVYALAAYLLINKGSLRNFGFKKAESYSLWKLVYRTTGLTFASLITGAVIFIGILGHLFPVEKSVGFDQPSSILQLIMVIWIGSSFAEEVFVRGLLQGLLNHLQHIMVGKISIAVLISGVFFGMMHLSLLFAGKSIWFVCHIVLFTTALGLLAAWYREKYNSIWPAFFIHVLANILGGLPIIIKLLL